MQDRFFSRINQTKTYQNVALLYLRTQNCRLGTNFEKSQRGQLVEKIRIVWFGLKFAPLAAKRC